MKEENTQQWILAVERFNNGESPEAICAFLHKLRAWLYKWVSHYNEQDASWSESRSCRPKRAFNGTPAETVEIGFIPIAEPWRNGMVESFNDRYQKMFLKRTL